MPDLPIAIVGASCRFPGASNLKEYWALLRDGREAIGHITEQRFATRFFGHPRQAEPGKSYSWAAGLLDDVETFDAGFFGISAREAVQIDPQQRLLIELAWESVEDAGLTARSLRGLEAGVYIGASATEYANLRYGDPTGGDAYFMTGNTLSIFANRISYVLDLKGPSMTIDTACSSSLIALHLACGDLREGRVPAALVGGVNLLLSPFPFIGFSRAGMLSKAGRCFAFDARGDGYVRGEGGGMVLLKPLADAIAAGDRVRGVILASDTNSDGRTIGLSLPSKPAQAALLARIYRDSGIDPDALAFLEAHGTGTAAGDPVEATAIGETLGRRRSRPLPIGSVKTNIGHLEPASGMAGLLKAMLALEHRLLPRSLNYVSPNPNIDLTALNLRIADQPIALHGDAPLAGVSGFGFGGTNAHVILAGPPARAVTEDRTDLLPPLLLSARSEPALRALASSWSNLLETVPEAEVPALLRGAARGRDHHSSRAVLLPETRADLASALDTLAQRGTSPAAILDTAARGGRLAFVFSGNGAQWAGMGRDALSGSPDFARAVGSVDAVLAPLLGWSVTERLGTIDAAGLARTDVAQPLLFAVQVGIVEALRAAGVRPNAVLGHSVGEIAAAWAAGAMSLGDAARLVVVRSRHQQRTSGAGRMAVLGTSVDEAQAAIAALDVPIEIAAINTPRSLTLAGAEAALAMLGEEADRRGWLFAMLDLDYAFHSAAMEPVRAGLIADLAELVPTEADCTFVSTVEGRELAGPALGAVYWWRNIREPVRFGAAIRHLAEDGVRLFLEIGPAPVLQSYVRDVLREGDEPGRVLPSLARKPTAGDPFRRIAGACHAAGYDLSRSPWYEGEFERTNLPLYPWQRERHWVASTPDAIEIGRPVEDHPLLGFRRIADQVEWVNHLDTTLLPWLADHKVEQTVVLPAAAIIEIALAVARQQFPGAAVLEVRDLEIRRAITLEADRLRTLRMRLDPDTGIFELSSRARLSDEPWARHASGRVTVADELTGDTAGPMVPLRVIEAAQLYQTAAAMGLHYGPAFQRVRQVSIGDGGLAEVAFDPAESEPDLLLDPRLIDGAFHGLLAMAPEPSATGETILLPWRFDSVRVLGGGAQVPVSARLRLRRAASRVLCADVTLLDAVGQPVARLEGCWFRPVQARRRARLENRCFRPAAQPVPLGALPPDHGRIAASRAAIDLVAARDDRVDAETSMLGEAFVVAASFEAITTLVPVGGTISVDAALRNRLIAPESGALLGCLLDLLVAHGVATAEATGCRLALDSGLPSSVEIWRSLFYGSPDLIALAALLNHAGETLAEALVVGGGAAVAAPAALRDQILFGGALGDKSVDALSQAIEAVAAGWPAGRPLRILELGAGRGIATLRLLRRLADLKVPIRYLATDPDEDAVAALEDALSPFQNAHSLRWDPLGADAEDGPQAGGFDLIIGTHVLASLGDPALASVQARFAPGGVFLTVEALPNPLWDFLFGQDPSWWQADGVASRLREPGEWQAMLNSAGFGDPTAQILAEAPWRLAVLSAQAGAATSPVESMPMGLVRIVADEGDKLAASLIERLTLDGRPVERVLRGRDGIVPPPKSGPATILLLPHAGRGHPADRLAEAASLVRDLGDAGHRLWLVTRGADARDPGEATLTGLGRTIANEAPALFCRRIDLDGTLAVDAAADALLAELHADDGEPEVVWTPEFRLAPRLRRGLPRPVSSGAAIRLALDEPGFLDSLRWREAATREPGPGEVAIDVRAAGLNFRDVMWAMGLLPEEVLIDGFAGPTLGMECAGVVAAVGQGVTGFAPGDRVMAFAPAALASRTVTQSHCVAPLADEVGDAAGATIPVAFLTVLYALGRLARLEPGETVLIHGGAGAVGLAAIQYAQHRGATIIATAGSPVKRALLRSAGVQHVLDSRSLKFADQVMALTGGEGIDVVLNSLGGEAMERSLGLLRPFGRFIELGKRDFVLNTRVGLRAVRHNIAYFAVDADELVLRRPDVARSVFEELGRLFAEGVLRPLPHLTLPFSEVNEAFRLMRASGHIGKIVLVPDAGLRVAAEAPVHHALSADTSFVVAGGLAGFGLAGARWLVRSGARHVALLSRRGPDAPDAVAAAASLTASGAETVRIFACDVGDPVGLGRTLGEIRRERPIAGILHAAMVVEDGLVATLDAAKFERVLRPKLAGAQNLDRLTRGDPIELFLLFSSATTLLGAPGQGTYVAANMALEALARRRHEAGLPALAVAWGPIGDTGYLADRPAARDALARRLGAMPLIAEEALAALPAMLASGEPVVALADVNWSVGRSHLPILAEPMFEAIAARAERSGGGVDMAELLAGKGPDEVKDIVLGVLLDEISTILRVARGSLEPARPLSEIGMDSLMAVELRIAVERRLGAEIPTLALNESVTLTGMAVRIAQVLSGQTLGASSVVMQHETADEGEAASLASRLLAEGAPAERAAE